MTSKVKEASEYLHIYANKMARDKAHQKAYGHIEAVKGDILKDKKGNNIIINKSISLFGYPLCPSSKTFFNAII
jgi:hypothetical protein